MAGEGIVVQLTEEEMYDNLFEVYEHIARKAGIDTKDGNFDCRCVLVAENVQESIISYYLSESEDSRSEVMTMLLHYGPKVDKSLSDNVVRVLDGFVRKVG